VKDGNTEEFENLSTQWMAGARLRFPFDGAEVGAVFGYGMQKFFLKGDEEQPIVPDVKYGYIRLGADTSFALGKVTLGGKVAVRLLGSLGELESLWFPGATGTGVDLGIFGAYPFSDTIGLVAGIDAIRYGFDFNAIPETNRVAAGGAIDQYFVGWLGVRFQLAGSASSSEGAVSAEASASSDDSADEEESDDEEEE
jgi:hypothetical protein